MILASEILMGRHSEFKLTDPLLDNLTRLLISLNKFRELYGKPMIVSSGWRPGHYNARAGGSRNSAHLTLEACDFRDLDGSIKRWVLSNPSVLEQCGLYMEDPSATPTWIHLQIRPTQSGRRVFLP